MRKKNLKLTAVAAAALSFLVCIAAACGLWARVAEAPITAEAKAGSSVVGELYSNTSSSAPFSKDNLNELAKKAGYTDINAMVTAAKNGTTKTASAMTTANGGTEWSVTLGGITWNPMYLSKDSSGNAILTLWQADATIASTWSDGTYSSSATKSWTENGSTYTLYSNSYDGSFVRNYLNGKTTYLSGWGSGSNTAYANTAISTTFAAFRTSGNIGDYVVSPSKVSWQTSLSTSFKNDASYSPVSGASNAGTAANYPTNWLNDKLWLPSIHETYDGTASNTTSLSVRDTSGSTSSGGLWQTSATQRGISNTSVSSYSWLRSGNYSNYYYAYCLSSSGNYNYSSVYGSLAVRPALHLNLTSAAGAAASSQKTPPADLGTASAPITYDGTSKKVEDMATKPSWYDSAMTFAYKKGGATVTQVTGAGVYSVTATLTDGSTFTTGSTSATFNLTVSPKAITVSGITASNKTYDGGTAATLNYSSVTYSGKISSDTLTVTATGTFADKNVGTGKTVTISNITLGGASASNYTLSSTTATTTANITAKSVTVSGITASDKIYDGNTAAELIYPSVSGVISGDTVTVTATGTFADKNVGTNKTVNITGITLGGASAGNYTLATTGNQTTCTADITAKSVTVSGISASDKTYDGGTTATLDFTNATVSGAVQGDNVSIDTNAGTGTFASKDVGTGSVAISGITLTGTDAGNYSLSSNSATANATITAATVTVTGGITANNKTYDGNTTATFVTTGATLTGVISGDTVTVTATGTFADKNAGTGKTVNITGLTLGGTSASNYTLATTGNQTSCTADITPKQLTVTINAGGGVYGGNITAATATLGSGYLSGEKPTVTLTYTCSSPEYNSTAVPTEAGTYTVTATIPTGNYALTGTTTANFVISAGGNSVSVSLTGWTYGDTPNTPTVTASFGGDTATYAYYSDSACTQSIGAPTSTTPAGTYYVKATIAATGSYDSAESVTSFTISKREITISGITASDKIYDGNTAAELIYPSVSGVISGDTVTVTATGTFADKNVGTNKTVNITGITLGGASAGNYTLATTGNQTTCTADITAKSVTVSGISASDKTYDGGTTATLDFTNATVSGAVQGDNVSIDTNAGTGTFASKDVGTGSVAISGITLTGTDAGNYSLSSNSATANATITAATVTVTGGITANNKNYDGNMTATFVTTGATLTGVISGDSLSVTATGTFEDKNAGTGKTVNITGLTLGGADASNYVLATTGNQTSCTADITPKQLTVTITAGGGVYGGNIAAATATLGSGYLSGEQPTVTLTYTCSSPAYNSTTVPTEAGIYTVTATIPTGNYALTGTTTANFVISAGGNSVSVTLTDWTYGDTPNTPTATASFGGDTATYAYYSDSACTQSIGAPTSTTPAGTYYIKATIAATGSYDSAEAITSFTISKKEITVSGIAANSKPYDGTTSASLNYSAVTYSGKVAGDDLSVTATGTFDTANAGYGKIVNLTSLVLGGADASNYVLATAGQQSTCTADVIGKEITVTGITATDKQYDGTTDVTFDYSAVQIKGVTAGDDVSVVAVGEFASAEVGDGVTVNITSLALSGADCANYMLAATGNQTSCTADITRREITVTITADDHDAEEAQAASAALNNVLADENVEFNLVYTGVKADGTAYSSAEAPTEKGGYTVKVSIDESVYTNYVLTGTVEKSFIITQTVADDDGNEVNIPVDGDFDFVVTQTPTNDNYNFEGISVGYSARLWVLAEDGTASAEYRESVRCNIIFKVPEKVADEILRSGKTLAQTQADGDLLLYAVTVGESLSIDEYKLYFDMNGAMYVKFGYEGCFPAEIVFNAPNVVKETQKSSDIPWWVWLIVALAAVAVIGVVIVIIVVVKKKSGSAATTTTVIQGEKFDDSDIQRRLADLENRDDGGFMDPYDGPND